MSIKLFIPAAFALMVGFGLGCIPRLNEYLHWNLGIIIPFSGFAIGAIIALGEFKICYRMNAKIGGWGIALLAAAATLGYIATDFGIYTTTSIAVSGAKKITDGIYRLRDLMTFIQYMKWRLGSSTLYNIGTNSKLFEMGIAGTTISYIADITGALIGSIASLWPLIRMHPYCDRCRMFKKSAQKLEVFINDAENLARGVLAEINEVITKGSCEALISHSVQLSKQYSAKTGNVKIVIDHRFCPQCEDISIVGTVYRIKGRQWYEDKKLRFFMTSQPQILTNSSLLT